MSTALSTHHRFTDPLSMTAAVIVIVGGASLIGVAVAGDSATAPSAPTAPAQVDKPPASRIGLGDFARSDKGGAHRTAPLKGGHSLVGLP